MNIIYSEDDFSDMWFMHTAVAILVNSKHSRARWVLRENGIKKSEYPQVLTRVQNISWPEQYRARNI